MRSVYVMKTSNDLYKIGIARDVDQRLKGLQTSNGGKIFIVTYVQAGNAPKLENQVHKMLAQYRQPGGREWFKLSPEQALKVCIYIHQEAQSYREEDEIRQYINEFAELHESLLTIKGSLETVTGNIGSDIQKAVGRLNRYRPAPKKKVLQKQEKQNVNTDKTIYEQSVLFVREQGRASTSAIQRRFRIGYGRAARIMEQLEENGVVGKADGARAREVMV